MSRSVAKQNLLKTIAKRHYSAQAALKPSAGDFNVDVTSKHIKVVCAQVNNPLAKISLSFRAGSRYEPIDQLGITHVLRKSVGLSTSEHYPFIITRSANQYGWHIYATTDRETFTITAESHPAAIELALDVLNGVATKPAFKPWEINDQRDRIKLELETIPPEAKVLDLVHQTAYRSGLGNSLFVNPTILGKLSNLHALEFFGNHFTASRLQVTSMGIPVELVNQFVSTIDLPTENGPQPTKATYYGGENRIVNDKEHNAYIAVAGPSPGYTKKEYLAYAALRYVYGNEPAMKYGSSQGILNKALNSTGALGVLTGISSTYSDSGLVGFFLAVESKSAAKAYESVVSTLLRADISDKDVARGKGLLKKAIADNVDGGRLVDFFANQVSADTLVSPQQLMSAVDSVTVADVKQAAQKIASGKLSAALYGKIAEVPYIDTIKK